MITPLKNLKISIISSHSKPPLCAFFTSYNEEEIPSYILEGTPKGVIIKHDLPHDKSLEKRQVKKSFLNNTMVPLQRCLPLKNVLILLHGIVV